MRRYETGLNSLARIGLATAAAALMALSTAGSAAAAKFNVVHAFCSRIDCSDGSQPLGSLLIDGSGNLYGLTRRGGKSHNNGDLFKLERKPDGHLRLIVVYTFQFVSPQGSLIMDAGGNFYGALSNGSFFKISFGFGRKHDKWGLTTLPVNCSQQPNCGGNLSGGLTYAGASSGAPYDGTAPLFAVAAIGGLNGGGTAFRLVPSPGGGQWTQNVLYNFCSQGANCSDGNHPVGGLMIDQAGDLFGATAAGGGNNIGKYPGGGGTIFELTLKRGGSWGETLLHRFCAADQCSDGALPRGGLIADGAGSLYGTTAGGGRNCHRMKGYGCGTVFKLIPNGPLTQETVLYAFCAKNDCADGDDPEAGVAIDASGNLFGTTFLGGGNDIDQGGGGGGVAFKLAGASLYSVLHRFCSLSNCADGEYPDSEVLLNGSGSAYGTTTVGGAFGSGIVFRFVP